MSGLRWPDRYFAKTFVDPEEARTAVRKKYNFQIADYDPNFSRPDQAAMLFRRGASPEEISCALDIGLECVWIYLRKTGCIKTKNPTHSPERDAAIVAARKSGRTLRDVGREFGIGPERVRQIEICADRIERTVTKCRLAWSGPIDDMPVDLLPGMGVRILNCLKNENLSTVGEVRRTTDAQLLRVPNFGRRSLTDLRAAIELIVSASSRSRS